MQYDVHRTHLLAPTELIGSDKLGEKKHDSCC